MKNTSDPKSVTLTIRLVEDVDSFYWEPISRRNEQRVEAWHHLTRKTDYLPCSFKTGNLDIPEIKARLKRVAKAKGFTVKRHHQCKDKFILCHNYPLSPIEPEVIKNVDLKWSIWSKDQETWKERQQLVTWERMRDAFDGTAGPVTVSTAPRKEIHYGEVTIRRGRAEGTFACEWDDAESLACTLDVVCDIAFIETLPGSMYLGTVGTERTFSIRTRTFQRLMEQIDAQEDELIKENNEAWAEFENTYASSSK